MKVEGSSKASPWRTLEVLLKGLNCILKAKQNHLKGVSVTCIGNTPPSLILDFVLKLARIQPHWGFGCMSLTCLWPQSPHLYSGFFIVHTS